MCSMSSVNALIRLTYGWTILRLQALYEAGEKQRGTETSIFIDIFTSRSGPQLHKSEKKDDKIMFRLLFLPALFCKN